MMEMGKYVLLLSNEKNKIISILNVRWIIHCELWLDLNQFKKYNTWEPTHTHTHTHTHTRAHAHTQEVNYIEQSKIQKYVPLPAFLSLLLHYDLLLRKKKKDEIGQNHMHSDWGEISH